MVYIWEEQNLLSTHIVNLEKLRLSILSSNYYEYFNIQSTTFNLPHYSCSNSF